jgi:hypothetical protein
MVAFIFFYTFGGVATGYLFARRVFVWGFILAYFPLRILTLCHLLAFDQRFILFSLWFTSVATEISLWRRKREKIV